MWKRMANDCAHGGLQCIAQRATRTLCSADAFTSIRISLIVIMIHMSFGAIFSRVLYAFRLV